jgi:hypothetical protein
MKRAPKRRLSKSRVVAGAQCEKLLWWKVHEPEAPELQPDRVHQAVFDAGHRVGQAAQACFPGGTEIPYSRALDEMVRQTQLAMESDTPAVFEAAFVHDGVFVAVDVLERAPDGWILIEVKSTKSVKAHHIRDAAVQVHVLRGCGVPICGVQLMHLNPKPGQHGKLFHRADIQAQVQEALPDLPRLIERLAHVLAGPIPDIAPGEHCRQPRTCAFLDRCIPPPPADATSRLYRLSKKDLARLLKLGHPTVHTIPDDYPLRPIQDRQRRAIVRGELVLEPALEDALRAIHRPAAYIDFESIAPALPPFADCGPYTQVPVQVSCHHVDLDGTVTHFEWLGQPGEDPRPGLALAVLQACQGAETLVAYSAGFEKQMIRHLKDFVDPDQAAALEALCHRFVDLLPIMRSHVYHPDFGGRFGLKAVTAALLPALHYGDLEVQAGGEASVRLADLILRGEPSDPAAQAATRKDLLAYCARDTQTMVALVRVLLAASKTEQPE